MIYNFVMLLLPFTILENAMKQNTVYDCVGNHRYNFSKRLYCTNLGLNLLLVDLLCYITKVIKAKQQVISGFYLAAYRQQHFLFDAIFYLLNKVILLFSRYYNRSHITKYGEIATESENGKEEEFHRNFPSLLNFYFCHNCKQVHNSLPISYIPNVLPLKTCLFEVFSRKPCTWLEIGLSLPVSHHLQLLPPSS